MTTNVTTTYTTSGDVPPSAWAAMNADMLRLLTVLQADGTVVTSPDGTGGPVLSDTAIGFTVTAPGLPPLTVQFTRAAGTGQTTTSHPATTGLVLAAMARAGKHWGATLTWESGADTTARALADTLVTALFGADDAAVSGIDLPASQQGAVSELVAASLGRVFAVAPADWTQLAYLTALIADLTAVRGGIAAAQQLLLPPAPAQPATKARRTRKKATP